MKSGNLNFLQTSGPLQACNGTALHFLLSPASLHSHLLPNTGLAYLGADKSLARPTSRCILFDGENISFDASLVTYINSTNIPSIMIINRIYENRNLLSL
jgi:hypothetical protein